MDSPLPPPPPISVLKIGATDEEINPGNRFPRQAAPDNATADNMTTTDNTTTDNTTTANTMTDNMTTDNMTTDNTTMDSFSTPPTVTPSNATTDAGGSNNNSDTTDNNNNNNNNNINRNVTAPTNTTTTNLHKGNDRVVSILSGSLVAMFLLVMGMTGIAMVGFLWGYKMSQRRKRAQALVTRTKHDIFEGVPNAASREESEAGESQLRCVLSSDAGPLGSYSSIGVGEGEVEVEVEVEGEEVLASGIGSGDTLGSGSMVGCYEETNV